MNDEELHDPYFDGEEAGEIHFDEMELSLPEATFPEEEQIPEAERVEAQLPDAEEAGEDIESMVRRAIEETLNPEESPIELELFDEYAEQATETLPGFGDLGRLETTDESEEAEPRPLATSFAGFPEEEDPGLQPSPAEATPPSIIGTPQPMDELSDAELEAASPTFSNDPLLEEPGREAVFEYEEAFVQQQPSGEDDDPPFVYSPEGDFLPLDESRPASGFDDSPFDPDVASGFTLEEGAESFDQVVEAAAEAKSTVQELSELITEHFEELSSEFREVKERLMHLENGAAVS